MKRLILIDGNNFGFSGMSNPRLTAGDQDTQAVFSVIRRVRNVINDHPDSIIMVLWDGKSWRHEMYSEYKANREKTEKQVADRQSYAEQAKLIRKGLDLLGVIQVSADNMEADDLAEILTIKFVKSGGYVTLMTADKDWQQLVSPHVVWVDIVHDKRCDVNNFQEVTGCINKDQFLERKCIEGDTGDNIKGIHGVGPKKVDDIFNIVGSFERFLMKDIASLDEAFKDHGKKLPKVLRELDRSEAKATMATNMRLMDLSTTERPEPVNLQKRQSELDEEGFKEFCYRNAFLSFLKNYDSFLRPFRENKYIRKN